MPVLDQRELLLIHDTGQSIDSRALVKLVCCCRQYDSAMASPPPPQPINFTGVQWPVGLGEEGLGETGTSLRYVANHSLDPYDLRRSQLAGVSV